MSRRDQSWSQLPRCRLRARARRHLAAHSTWTGSPAGMRIGKRGAFSGKGGRSNLRVPARINGIVKGHTVRGSFTFEGPVGSLTCTTGKVTFTATYRGPKSTGRL